MSIFKNNLNFIFDTLLNSRFLSFWKFNRYLPSIEVLTDTISLNSLYLFFSKVLKFAESFCKKLVFATNKDNEGCGHPSLFRRRDMAIPPLQGRITSFSFSPWKKKSVGHIHVPHYLYY